MLMDEEAEAFKRRQIDEAYKSPVTKKSEGDRSGFIRIPKDVLEDCKTDT